MAALSGLSASQLYDEVVNFLGWNTLPLRHGLAQAYYDLQRIFFSTRPTWAPITAQEYEILSQQSHTIIQEYLASPLCQPTKPETTKEMSSTDAYLPPHTDHEHATDQPWLDATNQHSPRALSVPSSSPPHSPPAMNLDPKPLAAPTARPSQSDPLAIPTSNIVDPNEMCSFSYSNVGSAAPSCLGTYFNNSYCRGRTHICYRWLSKMCEHHSEGEGDVWHLDEFGQRVAHVLPTCSRVTRGVSCTRGEGGRPCGGFGHDFPAIRQQKYAETIEYRADCKRARGKRRQQLRGA